MQLYDGTRYYHSIPGLLLGRVDDKRHESIHTAINKFIDTIPSLTESLENNFMNIGKPEPQRCFVKDMGFLISLLQDVSARGLEAEAEQLLRCVKTGRMMDYAHKSMKPFISSLHSLSIAMQKAQNFKEEQKEDIISDIEFHADMARNILAVSSLIDDGEYEKAERMIVEMAECDSAEPIYFQLLNMIKIKNYDEAKAMVNTLKVKNSEVINQLSGVDFSKKILVVDDMPEILSFVNSALKNHYRVIAVLSGKAALKVLETQKPDLFILDIDMPEMTGYELAETIRNTPAYEQTPLIFLTGNSMREHVTKAMAVGCNDFILKPTSNDYLLTKASKFLQESR